MLKKKLIKYWKYIVLGVILILGLIGVISHSTRKRKVEKIDKDIKENENEINKLTGKQEHVNEEKQTVKDNIKKSKSIETKHKENLRKKPWKKTRSTKDAKNNILNKSK